MSQPLALRQMGLSHGLGGDMSVRVCVWHVCVCVCIFVCLSSSVCLCAVLEGQELEDQSVMSEVIRPYEVDSVRVCVSAL